MRLFVDGLIALMLAALIAGVLYHHRQRQVELDQQREARQTITHLHEQALLQQAMAHPPLPDRRRIRSTQGAEPPAGFPETMRAEWFLDRLPFNPAAPLHHPWLDLAPPGDTQDHPPDPVLTARKQAGIWYNAERKVFRLRVPEQETPAETLALYNRLNNASLSRLPVDDSEQRRPKVADPTPVADLLGRRATSSGANDEATSRAKPESPSTSEAPDDKAPAPQLPALLRHR